MYLTKNSKSPFYQIVYLKNGKLTTKSTKKKLKSEALKVLSEFQKLLESEIKFKKISLSSFENEYRGYLSRTKTDSYLRSVRLSFRMLIKFTGNLLLTQISPKLIDQFITKTFKRSESAALLYYRTLKAAFNKAIDWEYIKINPFNKVNVPKVKTKNPVFITNDEFNLILNAVKEEFLRDFYITAFHTGMRAGELCNLEWNAVNLSERIITVKNTAEFTTKSKKERIIPINDTLYFVLKRRVPKIRTLNSERDYVFYRIKGVKLTVDYVSKKFKKAVRLVKLNDNIKLHSLRHSFASQLVQRGVNIYVVQQLLGHADYKTSQIYSHLQPQNLFDAVQKIGTVNNK